MKDTFTQFVRLGLIILALGICLMWVDSTWLAPLRLPRCEQSALDAEGKSHICWDTLKGRHGNKIIWIDARDDAAYEVNRLAGQDVCMFHIRPPRQNMEEMADRAMERLDEAADNGECIVVFCTNKCTNAEDVATYLRNTVGGSPSVYILEGGWDTIKHKAPKMLEAR